MGNGAQCPGPWGPLSLCICWLKLWAVGLAMALVLPQQLHTTKLQLLEFLGVSHLLSCCYDKDVVCGWGSEGPLRGHGGRDWLRHQASQVGLGQGSGNWDQQMSVQDPRMLTFAWVRAQAASPPRRTTRPCWDTEQALALVSTQAAHAVLVGTLCLAIS